MRTERASVLRRATARPLGSLRALALLTLAALASACGDPASIPEAASYRVEDGTLLDPQGRTLLLRGLNYANDHKFPAPDGASFLPSWESPRDFVELAGWGLDSVRLLVVWEALEPEPGRYDDAYLDRIRERLDWAHAAGVSVIVDMHQDLFARSFGGDGAPSWAVQTDGIPFELRSPWYLNFVAPALLRAIDNFFADRDGVLEHFVATWEHVVERLRDHPALIGYDLLNEPFPGSLFLAPDGADRDVLHPFYRRLIARLAARDAEHVFFVEPNPVRTNVLVAGYPTALGPYDEAPGRLMLAPHLYDPVVTTTLRYTGNDAFIRAGVRGATREAARLGWGLWFGEWSVWDGRVDGGVAFLHDQLAAFDEALCGWSFWNLSRNPIDLTSPIQTPAFLDELARPQLARVAGRPLAIECDAERCRFRIRESALRAPTEVRVPARFAATPLVNVEPPRRTELRSPTPDLTVVDVFPGRGGEEVTVTIARGSARQRGRTADGPHGASATP